MSSRAPKNVELPTVLLVERSKAGASIRCRWTVSSMHPMSPSEDTMSLEQDINRPSSAVSQVPSFGAVVAWFGRRSAVVDVRVFELHRSRMRAPRIPTKTVTYGVRGGANGGPD